MEKLQVLQYKPGLRLTNEELSVDAMWTDNFSYVSHTPRASTHAVLQYVRLAEVIVSCQALEIWQQTPQLVALVTVALLQMTHVCR